MRERVPWAKAVLRAAAASPAFWQGIYSYPVGVLFTATLIETGGLLSGSVHEHCTLNPSETLFFSVNGRRHGTAINFAKTYLGTSLYYGTIVYDGAVNDDATEIEGRWSIPGDWSGRFLMTRSGDPPRVAAESEGAESRPETIELTPAR